MNLEEKFRDILNQCEINPRFREMIDYSLFPSGKLFRPRLCIALAQDLNLYTDNLLYYAFALEAHHCYSLIHDDLPCMDNDDFRRGRPSLHKKFNEWKALLVGDGLINLSYELLAHTKTDNLHSLIKIFAQYTGVNGLIYGQYLDLLSGKKTLEQTLELHQLKTARLIQLSITGPLIINKSAQIELYDIFGQNLGLYFQIQDDLSELEPELSKDGHESTINLFLNYEPLKIIEIYQNLKVQIIDFMQKNKLDGTQKIFNDYQQKMLKEILKNKDYLLKQFNIDVTIL